MAIGPFISYAPPGVYSRTLTDANASNLVAGLRIPAIIGVGQEELEQNDFEIVRGSSSTIDQQIVNEDISSNWVVDSTNPNSLILGEQNSELTQFRVRNYPIVDGQGFGKITNDVRSVSVMVNGVAVALGGVQGSKGLVTLQVPTQPTDVVRVTYSFHRSDTSFTDDVSKQVTDTNATLVSTAFGPYEITSGVNDKFVVNVNGTVGTITLPAGSASAATIASTISAAQVPNLVASVFTDNNAKTYVQLTSPIVITIGAGSANGVLGFSSAASTNRVSAFRVYQRPIVDGTGSGQTTTDTSKVVVKVNGQQVLAQSVDGQNGLVTLPFAPAPGSTVTIQYWANTWQDTFDYLPHSLVTTVLRCGISPGRSDYIQGSDFVVSNPSTDVSVINWGSSFQVASATTSLGSTPFDGSGGSGGQITGSLIDDQMFLGQCSRVTDTSTIPATVSPTDYLLPEVPTTGNGRSTLLGSSTFNSVTNTRQDLVSNRPDLVKVYTGRNLKDAMARPAVDVLSVEGDSRRIKLKSAQPPDYNAYATFYYSRLEDDTFIFTNQVAGPAGVGQYTVFSSNKNQNLYQVQFGSKSGLSQTVQWPRGVEQIPDAFHTGDGTPVSETVTVTFGTDTAKNAVFTNRGAAPYSFYASNSSTLSLKVNGGSAVNVNLNTASPAVLVGSRVTLSGGNVTLPASATLNFTIDGVNVPVTLTSGAQTPTAIVADINSDLGSAATASFKPISGSSDVVFIIKGTAPSTIDSVSNITVKEGTANGALGLTTFVSVDGTLKAINKHATLVSSLDGPFAITAGLNDELNFRVDGVDYNVTLAAGSAQSASTVVANITSVVAGIATLSGQKIRLTSANNEAGSSVLINAGSANDILGFSQGDFASQGLVSAQDVVNTLMTASGFNSGAIAYVDSLGGQEYVTIESLTAGATGSSIEFLTSNALNSTTGLGIKANDGDVGEDAQNNFTVSSSNSSSGSSGVGYPGQTYTDARTGLRFTVLPATSGSYTSSGSFTLDVSPTFSVSSSAPRYSVGGLELSVSNTVGVGVGDTATVQTFNPDGVEPSVGDFYFISYRYRKQDYTPGVYQQLKAIESNFGRTSAENRVTLGAYLAILNGAVLVVIKQVLKVPNTNQASDQDFNAAIDDMSSTLPGSIKPAVIVPLATSTSVYTHLTVHVETQSNIRNAAERMGFIGFASGTSPTTAQSIARSLNSSRIVAFYPDSAVITLTDELGRNFESIVDGSMFAAAVAGAVVSPAVDVATPYTRRKIQGFTRIPRILDAVEASQTATAGITVLEDLDPIVRIRQGLTTNMSNVLTRLPTVTQISDFVQQQSRAILESFIGTKFLASRTNEVVVSMTGLFRSLLQAEIVGGYTGMNAEIDQDDPTVLRFEMSYAPIFPLLYIILTFNLRARL